MQQRQSAGGQSRFSNNRNSNSGRSSGRSNNRKKYSNGPAIEHSRFIKKAVVAAATEPVVIKHTFQDFGFHSMLAANVISKGYVTPTPIQDQAIPHIMAGKDLIGIANTGTGKTAAFLLPLINKCALDPTQKILVIVPTRELAVQVDDEFRTFSPQLRQFSAVCIGGSSMGRQISDLRRNPRCVIGTPGRLLDLIERRILDLRSFNNVILDEVDRMLDMGFVNEIKRMVAIMPTNRQSLFFSATLPDAIRDLAATFLKNPVTVSVRTQTTSANVDQDIIRASEGNKMDVLHDLLLKPEFQKVLVFIATKHKTEKVKKQLQLKGITVDAIHGDKPQSKRQSALHMFKTNKIQVLVATDVASRGLDIADVSHVINFDQPKCYDDYIHRIGRTGRGDKKGVALTFV